MISADLERFGLPHHKPNLASSLMLQELHRTGASLLPLVPVLVEPVQLRLTAINEKTQPIYIKTLEIEERRGRSERRKVRTDL